MTADGRVEDEAVRPSFRERDVVVAATALTASPLALDPLAPDVVTLLAGCGAPPRLAAHLRLVADAARRLVGQLRAIWPDLTIDADAAVFGAAIHDVGKARHPGKLLEQGDRHELDGERLLLDSGVDPERARFARTHAAWDLEAATAEDQLVALADAVWKGQLGENSRMPW